MHGWWAVAFVLFLVPSAAATLTLELGQPFPAGPVEPETGVQQIEATITMDCETVWLWGHPVFASAVPISVQPIGTGDVFVQGPGAVLLETSACMSSTTATVSATATYAITANRLAPGLEYIHLGLNATGPAAKSVAGQELYPDQKDSKPFQAQVDYFPYIQAKVVQATKEAAPGGPIVFDIEVTNFGNARTEVRFELVNELQPEWRRVILPPRLTLDTPNKPGGTTAYTAQLEVTAPAHEGWNNREQSFTLTMTPYASRDENKSGTPISVSMFARSRGLHCPPGSTQDICKDVGEKGLDCRADLDSDEACRELIAGQAGRSVAGEQDAKAGGAGLVLVAVLVGMAGFVARRRAD